MPTPTPKDEKPPKIHDHLAWKLDNLDNKENIKWLGWTLYWCSKDCHPHSMWCPRQNCIDRVDYKKRMEGTKSAGRGNKFKASKDFRVALSALVLDDKYCILEEQFLKIRWQERRRQL
eukprot:14805610-Ditylum_brightwellii.AAC.1